MCRDIEGAVLMTHPPASSTAPHTRATLRPDTRPAAPPSASAGEEAAELAARFFRVLGDPTRLRLLRLLLEAPTGERSVGELVAATRAPQSRVSTHLACLRWCGLVCTRREGKQVYYRVADPRVREVLVLAGQMLLDHAAAVASCAVIG